MYLEYFGFREYPFNLTPDTDFFYAFGSHQEALNVLIVALANGEGFLKVTGEVGLGKTLLCRTLLNHLREGVATAYLPNPHLDANEIRRALARELGIRIGEEDKTDYLTEAIQARVLHLARHGSRVVVLIDEAQQLSDAALEAIRLWSNLETEKSKLLQIILFGQPELDARLKRPELRQLAQRIGFSYRLKPMAPAIVSGYLAHRLKVAGTKDLNLFTPRAGRMVAQVSCGVPRLVNLCAHKALLSAYGEGTPRVRWHHVLRAAADTETLRSRLSWPNRIWSRS
ncbi:type II secretory pathway component ExeA (predicted ATPase) [mine drainage metagenome]|uniref:Type II secretory pathway component ExeA (Predicted ATPase) n=3 Tax=mine drainage metagenome TaxID=410659 RepID=T1BCA5_9ZZZZ